MNATSRRDNRIGWAIGVAVAALAGLAALQVAIAKQPYGYDLWAYVLAARHLLAGEPLYPAQPTLPYGPFGEYHYSPTVAVPFVLLAPLPFWLATVIWMGLLTGIAVAIGVYLVRPLPRDARPWAAAAYVLFLPTVLEITLGNLNLVSVALCLLAWSQRERAPIAGAILAAAVGLKLLPITLLLFYLASGRARVVLWSAGVGIGALALTAVFLWDDLVSYLGLLAALADSRWVAEVIASTPPREVAALLGSAAVRWLLPGLALLTAIAGGIRARARPAEETHLHHFALAFAPYLASFALMWIPYLVTALPLMGSTLERALRRSRDEGRPVLVAGLMLSWILMELVRNNDLVPIAAHLIGLVILGAIALSVLVLDRWPRRAMRTPARRAVA